LIFALPVHMNIENSSHELISLRFLLTLAFLNNL
jgi:hypothetical protein